jgi:Zn-dependent protease
MGKYELGIGLAWYLVFVFSTVCHEASHALVAWRLGDPTAYQGGQVSLNPTAHIKREPFGMVILPIVSYMTGGWMIGWASAPYDPMWARQYPKRAAMMSLAGPAANLLLILVAVILIRVGMAMGFFHAPDSIRSISQITVANGPGVMQSLSYVVSILFGLNLILLVFNLFPIPPLDGSGIIPMFLSPSLTERYTAIIQKPAFMIIGLVVAWQLLDAVFGPVYSRALSLLYPGVHYG